MRWHLDDISFIGEIMNALVVLEGQGHRLPPHLKIRHVSGSITDTLYNASVYKDDEGAVLGVFAAARDVTKQKQAETRV